MNEKNETKTPWLELQFDKPKVGQMCSVVALGQVQVMALTWNGAGFEWSDGYEYGESVFDEFPQESATHWLPLPVFGPGDDRRSLSEKLNALSLPAQEWLEKTCERFADSQGYDSDKAAVTECEAAGLVRKFGALVWVDSDVMEAVYSNNFFGEESESCP